MTCVSRGDEKVERSALWQIQKSGVSDFDGNRYHIPPNQVHSSRSLVLLFTSSLEKNRKFTNPN